MHRAARKRWGEDKHSMNEQDLEPLISLGHELPGVEFKGPGPRTDPHFFAKVTRAVLGMANRPSGGLVIVGVDEAGDGTLRPTGLSPQDVASWDFDSVSAALTAAADPFVVVECEPSLFRGVTLLVIRVQEFDILPVICKKHYSDAQGKIVLRDGAVYVRTRRKPETSEIPSQTEMRELLELAIGKGVRSFVARAAAAGLELQKLVGPTEDQEFDRELGELK